MIIHRRHLIMIGACDAGLEKFDDLFGDEMKVNSTNINKLSEWGTFLDEYNGGMSVVPVRNCHITLLTWFIRNLGHKIIMAKKLDDENWFKKQVHKAHDLDSLFRTKKLLAANYYIKISQLAMTVCKRAHKEGFLR